MSQTDRYFQFPLSALSNGGTVAQRCDDIIAYGLFTAGAILWEKLPEEKQEEWKEYFGGLRSTLTLPSGINWKSKLHLGALYGHTTLGVIKGNLPTLQLRYEALQQRVREFEARHGADVEVRVRKDLVFEVRDGKGMSYREFAVLCAINSVIGSKKHPVRITLETICVRALGYKSKKAWGADLEAKRYEKDPSLSFLTSKQARATVEKLHQLGWFARATYGQRQTFFSNRMDDAELRKKIFASKTFSADFKLAKSTKDSDMTAAIKAQRARNQASAKRGQQRAAASTS